MSKQTKLKKRKIATVEKPDYNNLSTPSPAKKRIKCNDITNFMSWSVETVALFLQDKDLGDVASIFKENGVTGKDLINIDIQNLQNYGISDQCTIDKLLAVLQLFKGVPSTSSSVPPSPVLHSKVFNDPVHGHIELHPLLVSIIDTAQFQRLRNIKQLGGCYFVFPGAAHNRFEHSIGTSHLAGRLVRSLKKRQPELGITEQDVLCVRIAGLCHDLGHGPFSHMFDTLFIPSARPGCAWKHEEASVNMFDHLVKENHLEQDFKKYGLSRQDMTFIKELIAGPRGDTPAKTQDWPYFGRPKSKSYLYEIVANKRTGIDVDKWDYFSRDCHNLGIKNSFDHRRYIKMARVIKVEQRLTICVRDKEAGNIYDMFHTRFCLFRRAYQHKTSNIIEIMICEAFLKADPHLRIEGKNGVPQKMSEAIDDMVAYTKLSDHVYYQILYSSDPKLQPAKEILQRIEKRQLYKCIGQTILKTRRDKEEIPEICNEIVEKVPPDMDYGRELDPRDITIDLVTFDYGMKDRNPIDNLRFYTKNEPDKAQIFRKHQVSNLLPESFREQHMRIYCRSNEDNVIEKAKTGFLYWCAGKECTTPKFGDTIAELTPMKMTTINNATGTVAQTLDFSGEDELIDSL